MEELNKKESEELNMDGKEDLMHDLKDTSKKASMKMVAIVVVLAACFGLGAGYFLSNSSSSGIAGKDVQTDTSGGVKKGEIYGSEDESAFKDSAEGKLVEGGINGEGKYHLERPGGESQNVYLISSTVNLGDFEGKNIKVWGETHQAQTAGWLMDVGRVEVL